MLAWLLSLHQGIEHIGRRHCNQGHPSREGTPMKEYRQNAAEADASKIHFVFDNRRAGPSRGPRRRLRPRLRTGTTTHKNGPERATRYPQPIFTFEGKRAATGPSGGRRDKAGVQKLRKSCSGLVRGLFEASNFDQIWRKKS